MEEARRLHGAHVTREDVFYATYALLHHPQYRLKYAENLKRELPRLPLDLFNEPGTLVTGSGKSHMKLSQEPDANAQPVANAAGSLVADSA